MCPPLYKGLIVLILLIVRLIVRLDGKESDTMTFGIKLSVKKCYFELIIIRISEMTQVGY